MPPIASISAGKFAKFTRKRWSTWIPRYCSIVLIVSAGPPIAYAALILSRPWPGMSTTVSRGIDYTGGCVVSRINGGFKNGGYTLRLKRGTTRIDGRQALALARTRENLCNRREDDRTRARRQQKILSAMKSRVFSIGGFLRLPLISWNVPKSVQSDMGGPRLLAYALGLAFNGNAPTRILRATPDPAGGSGLVVSDADKQTAVQRFLR